MHIRQRQTTLNRNTRGTAQATVQAPLSESRKATAIMAFQGNTHLHTTSDSPAAAHGQADYFVEPFAIWHDLEKQLSAVLHHLEAQTDLSGSIFSLVDLLQSLSQLNPDAGLAALQLIDTRKYTVTHAIHCALICDLLAKRMALPVGTRRSIMAAALTMNIAMLDLQAALSIQIAPPNASQRAQVHLHPLIAYQHLIHAGVTDLVWCNTVLHHHESSDGSGYPLGIRVIDLPAQILRLADLYCAKASDRLYRYAYPPTEALQRLVAELGENHPLLQSLHAEMGIFPPGTFVKLANQEMGVVTHRGTDHLTPHVLALLAAEGTPYATPIERDTAVATFTIQAVIARENILPHLRLMLHCQH